MRNFALAVGIMIGFFAGLILVLWATEQWSPWTEPTPTPTATHADTRHRQVLPTTTPSSTATATTTPTETLVPERVRVTWYGEAFRGGLLYCGTDIYGRYNPNDPTTVAVGADGPPCGSKLLLCSENACIHAVIKDRCGGCGPRHLDLSQAAWDDLGHPDTAGMTIVKQ